MCITFRTDMRKRSTGERVGCTSTWRGLVGVGLCDNLDLMDLVL